MKWYLSAALAVAASCIATEAASAERYLYGAVPVEPQSAAEARLALAQAKCMLEAATPPRGTPEPDSLYNRSAYLSCLYRHGFSGERPAYAYPNPILRH